METIKGGNYSWKYGMHSEKSITYIISNIFLIVEEHIVKETNSFLDGFPRTGAEFRLKKAKWEYNYRRYRKISKVFMPAPEKVHLLNYKAGLQEIAILELDRAFSDVGDFSNSLQYFQDITSFPNNLSGD